MNCYNEYGKAAYVKITEGKIVAKEGSNIDIVFAANNDGEKVAVIEEKGNIEQGFTAIQPVADKNETREGGISLVYSVDGTTAAQMSEEEKTAKLSEQEADIQEDVKEAVDKLAGEEVVADPNAENYVARVGTQGYFTFKAAVEAAQEGEVIWVLKDEIILQDDIGELVQEGPNAGEIQYGLTNEVRLSTDTTIEFGQYSISLLSGGKISRNGHALTFVGNSLGTGVYNCQDLGDDEFTSSGTTASVLVDLEYYKPTNEMRKAFYYSSTAKKWVNGRYVTAGGAGMIEGEDEF